MWESNSHGSSRGSIRHCHTPSDATMSQRSSARTVWLLSTGSATTPIPRIEWSPIERLTARPPGGTICASCHMRAGCAPSMAGLT
eukprot:5693829-Prymnesium_polylepis.2